MSCFVITIVAIMPFSVKFSLNVNIENTFGVCSVIAFITTKFDSIMFHTLCAFSNCFLFDLYSHLIPKCFDSLICIQNHRNQIIVLHASFQHVSWDCTFGSLCIRKIHSDTISCFEYFEYESPIWLADLLHSCTGYIWRAGLCLLMCTFRFPLWFVRKGTGIGGSR